MVRWLYKKADRDPGIWLIASLSGSGNGGIESEIAVAREGRSAGESTRASQSPELGELIEDRVRDKAA
jgi:hypothetical protein